MTDKLVPKLRFKDDNGNNYPAWQTKPLGNISDFLDGKRIPIKESERAKMTGKYPYYGASGIIDYVNDFIFDQDIILLGEDGENIISRNLPLAFKVTGKCWVNNHAHVISPNHGVHIDYLTQYLEQLNYKKYNTGTAQPELNQEICKNIYIKLPILIEQTKIADFLTSVDDKIQQLTKKKVLLEQYKKGIMQQIFSQQLRFKDDSGKDYPAWQERTLGDIAIQLVNGVSLEQNDYSNGYKVTRIETISDTYININRVGFIDTSVNIEGYKLKIGDMLFSNINSVKHIGKIAYVDKDYNLYHGMNLLKIRINDKNNSKYMYYVLTSIKYKSHFEKICNQAVNQASINQSELKKTTMHLPYLEEQTKIADFLTSIDDKITQVTAMLKQIQQYKKSLLQQMFI